MSTPVRAKPAAPQPSRARRAVVAAFREWAIFASLVTITSSITHVIPTLFTPYPIDLGVQMVFFGLVVFVVSCPLILVIFIAVLAVPPAPRDALPMWRTVTRWVFYALAVLLGSSAAFFTDWYNPSQNYLSFAAAFIPTAALVFLIELHRCRTATRRMKTTAGHTPTS